MGDEIGPLATVAIYFEMISSYILQLRGDVSQIPIIGERIATYLYIPSDWLLAAAYFLRVIDAEIENFHLEEFSYSPGMWLLVRLGADIGRAEYYKDEPWNYFIWLVRKEHPFLDALLEWDLEWIKDCLLDAFPFLQDMLTDPESWVWDKVKERWWWIDEIIFYPGRWLLVKLGADIAYAEYYRDRPWAWLFWKFRKEYPVLDALLDRDTDWLFNWIREAIDRYIDVNLDWLVRTGERLLNAIWQMRL